jgi:hypothetical protein
MKITLKWLEKKDACDSGKEAFSAQKERDGVKIIKKLIMIKDKNGDSLNWANWLITHMMRNKQQIRYTIFAAEQAIDIYEKKYPDDKRPREAIQAAKDYIKNPTKKNKSAARSAAYAAACAARAAAYAAACAAYAAACAAARAAAYAAACAAAYAADAADYAADAAYGDEMKIRILNYGLKILGGPR